MTFVSGGKTAVATASGQTLLLKGSRSRPLAGDENQPLKPKSRRPGAQVALSVPHIMQADQKRKKPNHCARSR
jgi:hypothetical protein